MRGGGSGMAPGSPGCSVSWAVCRGALPQGRAGDPVRASPMGPGRGGDSRAVRVRRRGFPVPAACLGFPEARWRRCCWPCSWGGGAGLHDPRAEPVTRGRVYRQRVTVSGPQQRGRREPRPRYEVQGVGGVWPPAGPMSEAARELAHAGPLPESVARRARAEELACLVCRRPAPAQPPAVAPAARPPAAARAALHPPRRGRVTAEAVAPEHRWGWCVLTA